MGWTTSECPLPGVEIHTCDKPGCRQLARVHFLSVNSDTAERRVARRCDAHAEELRTKIEKRAVAVAPAPKPQQQAIDPVAELLEAKPAEKPRRPPKLWPIPEGAKPTTCTSCCESIFWIITDANKRMPINAFGELAGASHFATCPNADEHRRRA